MSKVTGSKSNFFKQACLTAAVLMSVSTAAYAEQVLDYTIALSEDGKTYQVFMKPEKKPFLDINLSSQVTIKVPHLKDDNAFRVNNITSSIEGIEWMETSRVDAPTEDPFYDYLSFSFVSTDSQALRQFNWEADEEKLMFSFGNVKGCVEDVSIMENDDPFNVENNSTNTNPGNQFTNIGWGSVSDNNFRGTYGDKIVCQEAS